jgi:hypothetical protein
MKSYHFQCHYTYTSELPNETYATRKPPTTETWEISPVLSNNGSCVLFENLDLHYKVVINMTDQEFDKIVLRQEEDIAQYLKTAHELYLENKSKGT